MSDPGEIRERMTEIREAIARKEGEAEAIDAEMTDLRERICTTLDCDQGQETKTIKRLQKSIDVGTEKVEALLAQAEELADEED